MPDKTYFSKTEKIYNEKLTESSSTLLFKLRLYISQAPDKKVTERRKKEVSDFYEKSLTRFNSKVLNDCPPGKIKDRETGLCV